MKVQPATDRVAAERPARKAGAMRGDHVVAGGLPLLADGPTRFVVGPVGDLGQLEGLIAALTATPEVAHVHVELVQGDWVALVVDLVRPVALAEQLRRILGRDLVSCRREDGTLVARLASLGPAVPIPAVLHGTWAGAGPGPAPAAGGAPGGAWAGAGRSGRAGAHEHRGTQATSAPPELARIAGHALLTIADHTEDVGVVVFDPTMRVAAIAGSFLAHLGLPREQLVGRLVADVVSAPVWRVLRPAYEAALRGEAVTLEVESDATGVAYDTTVAPLRAGARIVGGTALAREVTSRKRQEATLTGVSRMFELSFTHSPIAKALVRPDGGLMRVNAAFARLLGRTEAALQDGSFQQITHPEDLHRDLALLRETLDGARPGYEMEKRYLHAAGHVLWTQLSVTLVRNDGGAPMFLIAQVVDITRQKQLEAQLRDHGQRDVLTGLWTRERLERELEGRLAEARAYGTTSALLSVQLDAFGWLLETSGHGAGDELLRATASAILAGIPAEAVCARLGGHQFAVLLPGADEPHALAAARGLAADVTRAGGVRGGAVGRASVGVAALHLPSGSDEWLRRAHGAMRRAAETGTGVAIWTPPGA